MSEKVVEDVFDRAQGGDGAVQITGIPQDDRGDEEVQAGGAMLLIFVGAVANFPEPMDEDGARQAVAGLALVKLTARTGVQAGPMVRRLFPGGNRIRTIGPASGKVVDAKFQRSDPGRSNTDFGRRC